MSIATLEPIVLAGDLFGELDNENESPRERKFKIVRNSRLSRLINNFEDFFSHELSFNETVDNEYSEVEKYCLKNCTSSEINEFLLLLPTYQDMNRFCVKSGLYLSALINNSQNENIEISTTHLSVYPRFLGCFNEGKNIKINGNVDWCVGYKMIEGRMTISGNTGDLAGYEMLGGHIVVENDTAHKLGSDMQGGKIVVRGNTGWYAGGKMVNGEIIVMGNVDRSIGDGTMGGRITVYGNAGPDVGSLMHGGEIYLNGDYESLADDMKGGVIYHKGIPIVKNGRIIR